MATGLLSRILEGLVEFCVMISPGSTVVLKTEVWGERKRVKEGEEMKNQEPTVYLLQRASNKNQPWSEAEGDGLFYYTT